MATICPLPAWMKFPYRLWFRVPINHRHDGRDGRGGRTCGSWEFADAAEYRWCLANCRGDWHCEFVGCDEDAQERMLAVLYFAEGRDAALVKLLFWEQIEADNR